MHAVMASDNARRAADLQSLWNDLALRHVTLAAGCGCGIGGVSLRLEDFELDIYDYLEDAASRSAIDEVVALFEPNPAQEQPLQRLLRALADDAVHPTACDWVLPRLERTLRSFAELHGARGGDSP